MKSKINKKKFWAEWLLFLVVLVGSCTTTSPEDDTTGISGTSNNGVISVSVKDNSVVTKTQRNAIALDETIDIVVSLYKKSAPSIVIATQTQKTKGRYMFKNLEHDTYAVRVDVNGKKGGLKENVIVVSEAIVHIEVVINIYITQNITKVTNVFVNEGSISIDSTSNSYSSSQLQQLENGDYILVSLPNKQKQVILVQGEQKQVVHIEATKSSSSQVISISSSNHSSEVIKSSSSSNIVVSSSSSSQEGMLSSSFSSSSEASSSSSKAVSGKFTDSRDAKEYTWMQIGDQIWMSENLKYKPSSGNSWCYQNDSDKCDIYGRLYDWQTTVSSSTSQRVCPAGWHVPSDNEWEIMILFVAKEKNLEAKQGDDWVSVGAEFKADDNLWTILKGTDSYGFSGIPGGRYRPNEGAVFVDLGVKGYWWSSTEGSSEGAQSRDLHNYDGYFRRYNQNKSEGYSVRCLKD